MSDTKFTIETLRLIFEPYRTNQKSYAVYRNSVMVLFTKNKKVAVDMIEKLKADESK